MAKYDVTTIGEGQLRYSVPAGQRLETADKFDVCVTGTELNVVCLLGKLGRVTSYHTSLPDTPLGGRVVLPLKRSGVDTSSIQWFPNERIATYYVEYAVSPRSSQVYYDRGNSPFTKISVDKIDWDALLDTKILHLSGLTFPISDNISSVLLEAVRRAKEAGVLVSFDMNYRSRLWTEDNVWTTISPIVEQVDILFFGRRDINALFGFEGEIPEYVDYLRGLTNAKYVICSLSSDGLIGCDGNQKFRVLPRKVDVIDRIGAGDAMVGGVLHGILDDDFERGLRYGVITAALALSQWGDQLITTQAELDSMLNSPDGGDITR